MHEKNGMKIGALCAGPLECMPLDMADFGHFKGHRAWEAGPLRGYSIGF